MEYLAIMNIVLLDLKLALVPIFETPHNQHNLASLVMTTFVALAVIIFIKTSSTETILSGMVPDVVRSIHVVPGTIPHGSGK